MLLMTIVEKIRRSNIEVHNREAGINFGIYLEIFGARTLLHETYRGRYSSLLAALDARLGISEHSHFRLIVRR